MMEISEAEFYSLTKTTNEFYKLSERFTELKAAYITLAEQYHILSNFFNNDRHTEKFGDCKEESCLACKEFLIKIQ